jgi:hypothetical protein
MSTQTGKKRMCITGENWFLLILFTFYRQTYLDFDGLAHLAALEQNFTPSDSYAKLRQRQGKRGLKKRGSDVIFFCLLGYPQLLSGSLADLDGVWSQFQKEAYFNDQKVKPWEEPLLVKRYNMSFPMFPFRTLAPRELMITKTLGSETGAIFPAHTQISCMFTRRDPGMDFFDFMLPQNLDVIEGSKSPVLSAANKSNSRTFTTKVGDINTQCLIKKVVVELENVYLQVRTLLSVLYDFLKTFLLMFQVIRFRIKNLSPEKPLANLYTSYTSKFTPIPHTSQTTINLAWESEARPTCCFLSFHK